MKIIYKRCIAAMIDTFMFGICFVCLEKLLPDWFDWFKNLRTIGYIILLLPFYFKDLIFKNASLGKKMFGLSIYTTDWNKPSFFKTVKRSVITNVVGYLYFLKLFMLRENKLLLYEWEKKQLNTFVIENKVYKGIKEIAKASGNPNADIMNRLYDEYLKNGKIVDVSVLNKLDQGK